MFNGRFLKVILGLTGLLLLAAVFSDRRAEVKQNLQLIERPILYNGNFLGEYVATIVNKGNYSAKNMRVILMMNNGYILKTQVKSQEQYFLLDTPLQNGSKELLFINFAPDSIAQIDIWTISSQNEPFSVPQLYTTFYGGAAEPFFSPIVTNGIDNIKKILTTGQ